jgi:hypothetical protein
MDNRDACGSVDYLSGNADVGTYPELVGAIPSARFASLEGGLRVDDGFLAYGYFP